MPFFPTLIIVLTILVHIEYYSYLIDRDICCVVLCEKTYSKRLAFSFLEDIAQEFNTQYGKKVNSAPRSWAFQEFGKNINYLIIFPVLYHYFTLHEL